MDFVSATKVLIDYYVQGIESVPMLSTLLSEMSSAIKHNRERAQEERATKTAQRQKIDFDWVSFEGQGFS